MNATKTMQVIVHKATGKAVQVNDRDDRYVLLNSKAHAARYIAWLGYTEVAIRPATEEETAHGKIDTVKS